MNTQDELFHEDWRDALQHLVKALGGFEAAGADLFPNKTRKAAGSWLSDCLNVERPAKLDLEDIESLLRLGRATGCHIGIQFLCAETDYTLPTTIEPQDTLAEVERQMDLCVEGRQMNTHFPPDPASSVRIPLIIHGVCISPGPVL